MKKTSKTFIEKTEFETEFFSDMFPSYLTHSISGRTVPSAFNGMCNVKKYTIKIQLVPESEAVYFERCAQLYAKSENQHDNTTILEFIKRNLKREYAELRERVEEIHKESS